MLNVLEDRVNKEIDASDADALEKVRELRRIAFDSDCNETHLKDVTPRKPNSKDFRKLGFQNAGLNALQLLFVLLFVLFGFAS